MGRRRCYFCGTAYTGTKCGKFGFFWRVGMTPGMTMHISSIFSWEPNTKISKEIASEKTIGVAEEGRILELAWSTRTRNPSDDARAHTHTHTPPSSHNTQHNTIQYNDNNEPRNTNILGPRPIRFRRIRPQTRNPGHHRPPPLPQGRIGIRHGRRGRASSDFRQE